MFEKGSCWRKWDLHIHTPESFEQSYQFNSPEEEIKFNGDIWEKYISELEHLSDIAVIGATDYFSIDGYKKIITYQRQQRLQNIFLFLPNVELRLDIFLAGNIDRKLNFHVIFSDTIDPDIIEREFLQELHIKTHLGEQRTLNRFNIEDLGRILKEHHEPFRDRSDFFIGCINITVSLDEVIQILKDKKSLFGGKYILVLPQERWDNITWDGQDHLTRKQLFVQSHALFSSNANTREWALGKRDISREKFLKEFCSLKPCIHGSDAHAFDKLCKPDLSRFCWIKADPTFEGLKQICYEPELRVKVQAEDPSESETYAKIEGLTINLSHQIEIKDDSGEKTNFCMNGTYNLEFSNNLTCIIGGRGSGKSTLSHIIYNSWINKDIKKLSNINSPLVSLTVSPNPLKKIAEITACEVPSQTEFFFQNEIEHAAKSIESMSTLIRHRLEKLSSIDEGVTLDKIEEYWKTSLEKVDDLIEAYDRIVEINRDIIEAKEDIFTLKKQTEIIKSTKYIGFQLTINTLSRIVSDFTSYQADFHNIIKQIDSLINAISELNWNPVNSKYISESLDILDSLSQTLRKHKGELNAAFAKHKGKYDVQNITDQINKAQQELREYLITRGLSLENVQELAQANTKIKELEEQIRVSQLEKKPYQEIYDGKEQIIEEYMEHYYSYKERFLTVSSSLQKKLSVLAVSQKEVNFDLTVDHNSLKDKLVEFVKDSIQDDITLRSDAIERLLFEDIETIKIFVDKKQSIRDSLNGSNKAIKHRQIIQELINDDIFLEKYHLRMLKYYYNINNIQVLTKLGGKLLKNTSFGERCGIVIAIIVVAGTNPIIIDQPEDHLDGKFISEVLVPLLTNQKHNRQIILITRDANVVVGGDAELIHILEQTDNRTKILPSSIENIEHREKYIWILDGGADAFSRREQKYDIDLMRTRRPNQGL